jgi:hypothetical protein
MAKPPVPMAPTDTTPDPHPVTTLEISCVRDAYTDYCVTPGKPPPPPPMRGVRLYSAQRPRHQTKRKKRK